MTTCLGSELNNKKLYKILNTNLKHRTMEYKIGQNEDVLSFIPDNNHSSGLYFSDEDNIMKFLEYGSLIATIKLDENEIVYYDSTSYRSHKFIIEKIETVDKFIEVLTEEQIIKFIKQNGLLLQYIKNQTENICIEAVKQNGYALQYVINQTEKICEEAIKQEEFAWQFIKMQTGETIYQQLINLQSSQSIFHLLLQEEFDFCSKNKK